MKFTEEEKRAAAHLAQLVHRQVGMGVPGPLALGVLSAALGSTAFEQGIKREDLKELLVLVEKGFDGAQEGAAQRDGGKNR